MPSTSPPSALPGGWKVGRLLGTGACSLGVYEVSRKGDDRAWCVKVRSVGGEGRFDESKRKCLCRQTFAADAKNNTTFVPTSDLFSSPSKFAALPPPSKSKSKKKTLAARNADQLFFEYTLYSNVLTSGLGRWLPDAPGLRDRPYGEVGGVRYLIMELVPFSLWSSLGAGVGVSGVASSALSALGCMHGLGLVFVDMKPDNVRVGDDGRARLIDVGCAERCVCVCVCVCVC